ncbi:SAM-dependent methyltransferase [Amycolatopsis sp. H20-H5]|uniref:SAM-dependent methyltransferase n=1 Tax=Amycolatopsis sp. H20-H5 TaxID=3046309 RepID=UPI002DBB8B8B|nr:SAM-dependent methyltransferase [Amycolatopsis sp. H20-H5]MEC3980915.1 SAM-dependent methyltransferase [Amycolatopsis sp. H20-H5]
MTATKNEDTRGTAEVIDTSRASIARVYDAFLGGKNNYAIDRAVMEDVLKIAPQASLVAKGLRRWLIRVTRYLANQGVDQFLDCGAGLPTEENTHQTAQRYNPDAVVVYVDKDPVVAVHGRALLEENSSTHFLQADLTRPSEVLANPIVTDHLDLDRPIALIQCATLHHIDDDQQPAQIMADYIEALPSGSYVALTHWWDPQDGSEGSELAKGIERSFRESSMGTGRYRGRGEIETMLKGLDLLDPGLVELDQWWPEGPLAKPNSLVETLILGAVGRKP